MKVVGAIVASLALVAVADASDLWSNFNEDRTRSLRADKEHLNSRIERGLSATLNEDKLDFTEDENGYVHLTLILPTTELVDFQLQKTDVMPPALQEKFPEIKTFSGKSVNFTRTIFADVDYSPDGGLHVYIRDGKSSYYIDPYDREESEYKAYSSQDVLGREPWACHNHGKGFKTPKKADVEDGEEMHIRSSSEIGIAADVQYKYEFTIAFVANGQYSKYHGNKVSSVLAAMVTMLNRVNGIYKREFGTFFQMHPDTDQLICLYPCSALSNNDNILDETYSFITGRGVKFSSFHIGHSLTTGSGGVAYLRSLCTSYRDGGTTGLSSPTSDAYYVDYVSHELGHQLGGGHTYQNCDGDIDTDGPAAEPGSGSTIMAYAGICGSTNLQSRSDPMFHAASLKEMLAYIDSKARSGSCGKRTAIGEKPTVGFPSTCTIPAKQYFQLAFSNPQPGQYFTIDTVDRATKLQSYTNRKVARFRSWMPSTISSRTFPHMYTIVNQLDSKVKDEILPVSSRYMTFRGTVRSLWDQDGDASDKYNSNPTFGSASFLDSKVYFNANIYPLKASLIYTLVAKKSTKITWSVGGTSKISANVKIMIAEHNSALNQVRNFDYQSNVPELNWIEVATVKNSGSATVTIPSLPGVAGSKVVHLMIRSTDDTCFFFDIVRKIAFTNVL